MLRVDLEQPFETEFGALVEPWDPNLDLEAALARLAQRPHALFLDSARRDPRLGRYSFLTADPFLFLEQPADGSDALAELAPHVARYTSPTIPELPPFQGGAAGLFSYDLGRSLERLPRPRYDEFGMPALAIGLYDVVLAIDHVAQRAWLISQGFPETEPAARRRRAAQRLEQFSAWLDEPAAAAAAGALTAHTRDALALEQLAPQFSVPGPAGLTSNFSADDYLQSIQRAIDYIRAGDVFQVNLAQRLLLAAADDAVALYVRLRRRNPATFGAYFDLGAAQIVSASPERFVRVHGQRVETRPIKGTRQRTARPEADLFAGDEMLASEKDRAENVMIVDLLRNDLSRVCLPASVQVTELCQLESYEFVQHLVSAVQGELTPGRTPLDLLRAAFPGGSVTGAPKVRAMEIIAELEPTARGAYCGSLGYLGFDGALDTNILIRTITASRGWWQAPVGGGIVAQSVPQREYEETWHKATGLLRALG
ncbi:MAG: aminodeoxychorismate synthase component I [Pirellulales bacterium]